MSKEEYQEYFYARDGICLEPCKIRKGVRIGSVTCRGCEYCAGESDTKQPRQWIKCKRIDYAVAEKRELKMHNMSEQRRKEWAKQEHDRIIDMGLDRSDADGNL